MQSAQTYVVLSTQECIIERSEEIFTDIYKYISIYPGMYSILIIQYITFEIDTLFFPD